MYILALLAAQWGNSTSPFHKFINSINLFELHFGSFWEKPNLSISVAHGHTSICPFSQIRRVEENKRCQLLVDHVYFALLAMLTGGRTDAFLPRGLLFTTIEHNNKKIKTNSWGHFDKGHCYWTFSFFFLFVPVFNDIVDQWFCVSSDCLLAKQTAGPMIIIVVVAMLFAM